MHSISLPPAIAGKHSDPYPGTKRKFVITDPVISSGGYCRDTAFEMFYRVDWTAAETEFQVGCQDQFPVMPLALYLMVLSTGPIMGLDPNDWREFRGFLKIWKIIGHFKKLMKIKAVTTKNKGTCGRGVTSVWCNDDPLLIFRITGLEYCWIVSPDRSWSNWPLFTIFFTGSTQIPNKKIGSEYGDVRINTWDTARKERVGRIKIKSAIGKQRKTKSLNVEKLLNFPPDNCDHKRARAFCNRDSK